MRGPRYSANIDALLEGFLAPDYAFSEWELRESSATSGSLFVAAGEHAVLQLTRGSERIELSVYSGGPALSRSLMRRQRLTLTHAPDSPASGGFCDMLRPPRLRGR